jgi:hypothetical protein
MHKKVKAVAKLFKSANINIAYKTKNVIGRIFNTNPQEDQYSKSSIYQLQCSTCVKIHIRQTRTFHMRYKDHVQDIKNSRGTTGFPRHILNTGHEYGKIEDTMRILDTIGKGPYMKRLENFCIQKIIK